MNKQLPIIFTLLLCFGLGFSVKAGVVITTAQSFSSLDASDGSADGVFTVTGNLVIANGGSINNNDIPGAGNAASPITIVVSGNMEIQAGGAIYAENRFADGNGGNISITVGGTFIMRASTALSAAAIVSGSNLTATSGNMNAGNISIHVTGNTNMENGSITRSNAFKGKGGNITISSSNDITVDGNILSQSGGTGAGNNQGHGGTISITTIHSLLINDNGTVSSSGLAPGADLVHLCACTVTVWGLVESTGSGHAIPHDPANYVSINRPDRSANTTAAIEIWAANSLIIDNLNHNGQVNADLCCSGGTSGESWIDLFSKKDITITGGANDTRFAVHANGQSGNNDNGGTITIKAKQGNISATGHAVMANGTALGGTMAIEASGTIDLNTAILYARGDLNPTGGFGKGGKINVRSFNNSIVWQNGSGDVRPTGTHGSLLVSSRGEINFTKCIAAPDTTGSSFPNNGSPATTPVTAFDACTGEPALPGYVTFCECPVVQPCISTVDCSGAPVIIDQNVTIDFNQADPNNYYSGDADLKPFFSYDVSGITADKWKAIFNLTNHKLIVKTGFTITVLNVGAGNNKYAPGIVINSTCDVEVEQGGHIVVASLNRQAGDILVDIDGDVLINGEVRNEVTGTNGRPGALIIKSKFGNISIGQTGQVYDLGVGHGGNLITLSTCGTCAQADIVINGLVKSFAHDNNTELERPGIRVVALNGVITINANTAEPLYDEFQMGGGNYDIYGGLLAWVRDNSKPGNVWVQAKNDITVNGHGVDPTGPVRNSFGAIASIATASSAPGGLVDVRSLEGSIIADNRAFDVSGRNRLAVNYAHINLAAKQDIVLSRTGADNSFNPVLDASSPGAGDHGGSNTLRSYAGNIIIGTNVLVLATVPAGSGSTQGLNLLVSCSGISNNGMIDPADLVTGDDAGSCSPQVPEPIFITCNLIVSDGGPVPVKMNSFYAKRINASTVNLTWETASELNAKEFVLQRKTMGGFEDIAVIPAKNIANGSKYMYTDNNSFKGISEYRIAMVDLDAKFAYSEIRAVKGISTTSDFTIYPNPARANADITIADISEATDVQLVDLSGRVLKTMVMNNANTMRLPGLQPGMYMVRIVNKSTGEFVTKKLAVVK